MGGGCGQWIVGKLCLSLNCNLLWNNFLKFRARRFVERFIVIIPQLPTFFEKRICPPIL